MKCTVIGYLIVAETSEYPPPCPTVLNHAITKASNYIIILLLERGWHRGWHRDWSDLIEGT